jgi:hypothetical protein
MAETAAAIPWRPAFVQAIKLELEPYRDKLETGGAGHGRIVL